MKTKISDYNYYVEYSNRIIYCNGITGKIFSTTKEEHQNIQHLFSNLYKFNERYASVYNQFVKWGFIVDDDNNEVDIIKLRNKQRVYNDRNYNLTINPTLECNFNCWYCYEEHPKGRMSEKTITSINKHIKHMVATKQITSLNLCWFGGEPLLYLKEVIEPISIFAKDLFQKNNLSFTNQITTNASLINDEAIEIFKKISLSNFQITIDGDENRHNKIRNINGNPTFNTIINSIINICQSIENAHVTLRINYDEKTLGVSNIESIFESIPQEIRKKIRIDFQRVWQTSSDSTRGFENTRRLSLKSYSDKLGFIFGSNTQRLAFGKGSICYADRFYQAEINYDGTVYKCTARGYTKEYEYGIINDSGIIEWNEKRLSKHFSKASFDNELCLKCNILPLCLGHCVQRTLEMDEANNFSCAVKDDEVKFESFIIDSYLNLGKVNAI